jgi:hypothetical protein
LARGGGGSRGKSMKKEGGHEREGGTKEKNDPRPTAFGERRKEKVVSGKERKKCSPLVSPFSFLRCPP